MARAELRREIPESPKGKVAGAINTPAKARPFTAQPIQIQVRPALLRSLLPA